MVERLWLLPCCLVRFWRYGFIMSLMALGCGRRGGCWLAFEGGLNGIHLAYFSSELSHLLRRSSGV